MKTLMLAAVALACSATPVQGRASPEEPGRLAVYHGDLDLTRPEGRATLDRRLSAAARAACRNRPLVTPLDWLVERRCERVALADARQSARIAIARAQTRLQLAQARAR